MIVELLIKKVAVRAIYLVTFSIVYIAGLSSTSSADTSALFANIFSVTLFGTDIPLADPNRFVPNTIVENVRNHLLISDGTVINR